MPQGGAPSVDRQQLASVRMDRLEDCVRALDPASRALLDLSLRRHMRDDDMAPVLQIDSFNLAWRRARAIERLASLLELDDPSGIAAVRAALPWVRDHAWGVPKALEAPAAAATPAGRALVARRPSPAPLVARPATLAGPDRMRAAVSAARNAAASTSPATVRGALLAGAGALFGAALSRRRRRL